MDVDKLVKKTLRVHFLKFVFLSASFLATSLAKADPPTWPFNKHPHPFSTELTESENRKLTAFVTSDDPYCKAAQKYQFELYQKRFPAFKDWKSTADQFRAWKRHMMQPERRDDRFCIATNELETLIDLNYRHDRNDFRFCGIFTRPANSDTEQQIAILIEELFEYIRLDERGAAYSFLTWNSMTNIVMLHPDVEYYFRAKFLPPSWHAEMTPRETAHPNHIFTPERLAFLNKATAKDDLQSIIDSMGPCLLSAAS